MQESGSQQDSEEDDYITAKDNNDPMDYAEFMSTNS